MGLGTERSDRLCADVYFLYSYLIYTAFVLLSLLNI